VPLAKRKTGRGPIQRLSDQRRSLALAGLAVGAVFSAAILRRKRRGGEAEFEQPMPPVAPSVAQPESGPPPAVPVPPPATEPEPAPVAEPTGATSRAGTSDAAAPAGTTATAESTSSPSEPATGELSAEEASILSVLAQSGRTDEDRTAIAIATSLERETTEVAGVLRKLGTEGVVAGDLYTAAGDKIWAVTERGVRRLGAQS
jgi:hypothetical protein